MQYISLYFPGYQYQQRYQIDILHNIAVKQKWKHSLVIPVATIGISISGRKQTACTCISSNSELNKQSRNTLGENMFSMIRTLQSLARIWNLFTNMSLRDSTQFLLISSDNSSLLSTLVVLCKPMKGFCMMNRGAHSPDIPPRITLPPTSSTTLIVRDRFSTLEALLIPHLSQECASNHSDIVTQHIDSTSPLQIIKKKVKA